MKKHLTNYHSHCDFCDGRASIEEFVQAAISEGFTAYGISSHSPLPDYTGHTKVLQLDAVGRYLDQISELKTKYQDQIEIYAGMEIDYIDSDFNPASKYFQELPLDYRIGSVHFLKVGEKQTMDADTRPDKFVVSLERYYNNDLKRLVIDYFDSKMRMIETGGFDFVGHADKISMNASSVEAEITQKEWYKQKTREYYKFISEQEMMLEINTKALFTTGMTFPNENHYPFLCKLGIPLVVNSDAHSPHLVNSGRMETIEKLKAVGYKTVRELHKHKWQDIEI